MVMSGLSLEVFAAGFAAVVVLTFVATEWLAPAANGSWRIDLTRSRRVRGWLRSRWLQAVPQLVMTAVLLALLVAGLFGSPTRNISTVVVWTLWWGGLVFLVLFLGSAWCFVCPWDGLANLMSRLRVAAKVEPLGLGLRFPPWLRNVYPGLVLFALLTWLELGFGVTTDPRATAYMGLGMAGLAVTGALLFEGKQFCAWACPVGRITGLYSNFSPVEIRARKPATCHACVTEDCLHGAGAGYPCPTGISLKTAVDSTGCTMCTECFKSCAKQNVALKLRPFGADLGAGAPPRTDLAWFAVVLLGLTLFHGLSMTAAWESTHHHAGQASVLGWMSATFGTPRIANFTAAMAVAVALPIGLYALGCRISAAWARVGPGARELFVAYAASLLPIALFYHLAHNLMHLLTEGGAVVPAASDPMGSGADLFGTRDLMAPALASGPTLWWMQVALVLVGHVYAILIAHRIAHRLYDDERVARRALIPLPVLLVALSVAGLWLMHMDMNMRLGRM